ncbi:MAG: hypothetical protein A07HR60_01699 [uncultured archaeon A07HR60]|nr:MAG: hypothetical protein A07HR60_01699 [uncultured archaeon A07HR60]
MRVYSQHKSTIPGVNLEVASGPHYPNSRYWVLSLEFCGLQLYEANATGSFGRRSLP